MKKQFRSFEDAHEFAIYSKIKTGKEWKELGKQGKLPKDIPNRPDHVYKDKGWKDWGHFLGTGFVASFNRKYRSFTDAQKYAISLNFNNKDDWNNFCNTGEKPKDIPNRPDHVYKDKGWKDWGHFLGTGNMSPTTKSLTWISFVDARKTIHSLNLKNIEEWKDYCKSGKKPDNIPSIPNTAYKNKGWINWGDWLGTGYVATFNRKYESFEIAKKIIYDFKILNIVEWRKFAKSKNKPETIPANPPEVYKDQWKGWGDWLGTGKVANQEKQFRSFEKTRDFVQKLNFKNRGEWEKYSKSKNKPIDIPANPGLAYKNKGWKGWGYFLGTGKVANQILSKNYLSFIPARNEARMLAKKYNLKTWDDWVLAKKEGKIPDYIPLEPNRVYSKNKRKINDEKI